MRILLLALGVFIISTSAQAQDNKGSTYTTALGVKVWDGAGVTLKHFVKENRAIEGIAYFWNQGVRVTGLYEFHFDIGSAEGLKWYLGPGAHIGFYNDKHADDGVFFGLDGVIGLDYKFKGAPINLSIDWQPAIEFGDGRGFEAGWAGLGIRYTF